MFTVLGANRLPCSRQTAHDRADRNTKEAGNLGVCQTFDYQFEHHLMFSRQTFVCENDLVEEEISVCG